jgi:hypothetical protein
MAKTKTKTPPKTKEINNQNNSLINSFHPFYILTYANDHLQYLNNSKFFAGVIMILLNVGSKFISIQFSKSTEEYLKMSLSKQILVFAMAWMGTRDIVTALLLTAVFVILSDHIFNEESPYCMVPQQHRVLDKLAKAADTSGDGLISEEEINSAIQVLEKAKKEKQTRKNAKILQGQDSPSYTNN